MLCNWGILGPGFVATRATLPALLRLPQARPLAIASRNGERAREVAQQFGIERSYHDYRSLLADKDIDVVYIALPNHLHHPWTLCAAEAGKHVLCEKPLALHAAECAEMISACQRANVLLMEAVMYRFHPRMLFLKQLLATGELGRLRFVHAAFSFPFNAPDNYRSHSEYGGRSFIRCRQPLHLCSTLAQCLVTRACRGNYPLARSDRCGYAGPAYIRRCSHRAYSM